MENDSSLAAFQAALLDLLIQPLPPEEILARLKSEPAFEPYQEYISGFDLRSVQVAAELVKKWGRRDKNYPDAL